MTINSPSSPIKDLLRQQELLKKEYEYEKEIYQQQTERIGIRKKINKGLCWYPIIIGRSRYNSLNQLTIEIERREDRETEHNFEYGRPVRFFRMDLNGKCHFFNHTCHVSYAEENRMVVVLPSEAALREIGSVNEGTKEPVSRNRYGPTGKRPLPYPFSMVKPFARDGSQ